MLVILVITARGCFRSVLSKAVDFHPYPPNKNPMALPNLKIPPLLRRSPGLFHAACAAGLISSAPAANLVINGEFTASLSPWTVSGIPFNTGDTAVFTDNAPPPADPAAPTVSLFQTALAPQGYQQFRLSFDYLNALSPDVPTGFLADTSFATLYLGDTAFGASLGTGIFDEALGLVDIDAKGTFNVFPGSVFSPSPKGAGWTRYSLTRSVDPAITSPHFFTIAFELYNLNGTRTDSTLAVDNVVIDVTPIPEPGFFSLTLPAALLITKRRRRP